MMRRPFLRAGLAALLSGAVLAAPEAPALKRPTGVAVGPKGGLFLTDLATHRVLRRDPTGQLTVVAGTGAAGFSGDGGPAVSARLNGPHDVVPAPDGSLLVADTYNHRIRRIDRNGVISTVVGSGLNNPQGIALGPDGSLFVADTYNHVVRRVSPGGKLATFAGSEPGLAGDGGPATRAQMSLPNAVAVAPDGSVYISDSGNNRIRWVKPDGTIETVLGTGPGSGTAGAGFSGDGGPAERARIFAAADVEVTPGGDLLVSDSGNHRIRRVSKGIVTTYAGSGAGGTAGDGGPAVEARLNSPQKIAVDADGVLYVADRANGRIRRVAPGGTITTLRMFFNTRP